MEESLHPRLEHRPIGFDAGGAHRSHCDAVIPPLPRDDLNLVGLASTLPVVASGLETSVVRLGSARRQEEAIDAGIADLREFRGQLNRRRVGAAGIPRAVSEAAHLLRGDIGKFATTVSGGNIPKTRNRVNERPALLVKKQGAFAANPAMRVGVPRAVVERVDQVFLIQFTPIRGNQGRCDCVGGVAATGESRSIVCEVVELRTGQNAGPQSGGRYREADRNTIVEGADSRAFPFCTAGSRTRLCD